MNFIKIEVFLQNTKSLKKIELGLPIDFSDYDKNPVYCNLDNVLTIEPLITDKDEYFTMLTFRKGDDLICPLNFNNFEKRYLIKKKDSFLKLLYNKLF